jgi:phosphate acetyltransferase
MTSNDIITNRTFDEISLGDTAATSKTITRDDIAHFAWASGDTRRPDSDFYGRTTVNSMLGGVLTAGVLGTRLPGPGTTYVAQTLRFTRPIVEGDIVTTKVTVREKRPETKSIMFECLSTNADGAEVLSGTVEVIAPTEKFSGPAGDPLEVKVLRHEKYERLIERCRGLNAIVTAVAFPCDELSLSAVIDAARAEMIVPCLVGPAVKLQSLAKSRNFKLDDYEIVDVPDSHSAAAKAVELVRTGKADLLMKGSLHTDELLGAVVRREGGLRTPRRISHCFVMDVPAYPKPLIITDAAVNIAPTLEDKVDIAQNAIDLAQALGLARPRVAILAAVETVNPKMESTLHAAALSKMADRGQITGAFVDGPLAFDNAISSAAANVKGIVSPVAGQADILIVPDLEAGNMVYKNLSILAHADGAGLVLGAGVPIILTSRADSVRTRLASCAVASLYAHAYRTAQNAGLKS